jgi:copper(I)-binding protein
VKVLSRGFYFFIVILLALTATTQAQGILVKDAWIRGVPPSAKTTAAFMNIQNNGPDEMVLVSAASEIAELVQIHTMEHVGEMMKMKEIKELRVPANGEAVLTPMGYHIMLIGLNRTITEGETLPLSLNFADGTKVSVDAVVKKWGPMGHNMGHN